MNASDSLFPHVGDLPTTDGWSPVEVPVVPLHPATAPSHRPAQPEPVTHRRLRVAVCTVDELNATEAFELLRKFNAIPVLVRTSEELNQAGHVDGAVVDVNSRAWLGDALPSELAPRVSAAVFLAHATDPATVPWGGFRYPRVTGNLRHAVATLIEEIHAQLPQVTHS